MKGENGALERISMEYDLSDHWSITGGVVWYQSGDKTTFSHIGDNDRFFFEARYRF